MRSARISCAWSSSTPIAGIAGDVGDQETGAFRLGQHGNTPWVLREPDPAGTTLPLGPLSAQCTIPAASKLRRHEPRVSAATFPAAVRPAAPELLRHRRSLQTPSPP